MPIGFRVSVCDVPAIKAVCSTVGTGAGEVVAAPFNYLAASAGAAAKWMFEGVWSVFDASTVVDLTRPGFVVVYNVLFGVAVFVMLLFFLLQLITGLLRRDPGALARAVTGLGKSVIGSFLVVAVTGILLTVVDQLSVGIVQATGSSMEGLGAKIATLGLGLTAVNVGSPGAGAVVTIFLAGLAISGTALLWFSLLVRKALLLVLIVLAPIALSGGVWDVTRGWASKWAATVVALAVSKLVIVVVFLVATAQLASPVAFDLQSIGDPIAGVVLMFVAAFAPYMCYRFVSFMGFDVYHSIASEQDAKQALNRPVPLPTRPLGGALRPILDGAASSRGGNGSAPTPPSPGPSGTSASAAGPAAGGASAAGASTATTAAAPAGAGSSAASGAAVGPVGVGVAAGVAVAGAAAGAGPRIGRAVRGAAADSSDSAAQGGRATLPAAQPPSVSPGTFRTGGR